LVGGALSPDSLSYVDRPADDELFHSVLAGELCYVFASHHMGKSSLMLRTAGRLQGQGTATITADLANLNADSSLVQVCQHLIERSKHELNLRVDPGSWWVEQSRSEPIQRFVDFLLDEVLAKVEGSVVFFLDGIDAIVDSDTLDGLLTAIQFVYQSRTTNPVYGRLTFVLLGTVSLDELIRNHGHFPFRVGHSIDLREFSPDEAGVLRQGLQAACPNDGETVFSRIFFWTSGHPYLTQKLCMAVASEQDGACTSESVDGLVKRTFLLPGAGSDPDLEFVNNSIRTSGRRTQLLSCYRQVYKGRRVREDKHSFAQNRLKLLGLVRGENGTLTLRNEVYRQVFDSAWIKANMPVNWTRRIAVVAVLLFLVLAGFAGFYFLQRQQPRTSEAQTYIDTFRNASEPRERLTSLAGLFMLSGKNDEARRLFYEELSPTDRSALFELADPRPVGEQLIVVVKGVYTDPRLRNNEQNNALLGAMLQPLAQLEHLASMGALGLELEIRQWLKAREYYNGGDQYQEAVHAYDIAINLNSRNPGTYFDRAMAYSALGETDRALADLEKAGGLDARWQGPVQEALIGDAQLSAALGRDPGAFEVLMALVPTATSKPAPANTPAAFSTPSPISLPPTAIPTETSLPSTSTPTVELNSTPTPAATPTATPTATSTPVPTIVPTQTPTRILTPTPGASTATSIPTVQPTATESSGAFTLLEPVSLDNPTYGPTEFVWQWTGNVPPGLGFEVRVWREGDLPVGAHDALLDNRSGKIQKLDGQRYRLSTNIEQAAGVGGRNGIYFWTVALVQVSPSYADLGQQAEPAQLRLELLGAPEDEDAGGGVGVD
jgi:tetratricopeptide (TPR) repeat protein